MNAPLTCKSLLAITAAAFCCGPITSCSMFKKKDATASNNAYTSYPGDGSYKPYAPGSQTQYQQYNDAPPPPEHHKTHSSTTASSSSTKKKSSSTATKKSVASSSSRATYVVKHKDTLYSIAKKYHTTVSKLKTANHLSSDVIRDGQKLRIP